MHHSIQVEIVVKDPVLEESGGFTSYMISGTDKLGAFEIRRRFNDFFVLREGLRKKFPGCYIPPIPEKKVIVKVFLRRETNRRSWWRTGRGSWTISARR